MSNFYNTYKNINKFRLTINRLKIDDDNDDNDNDNF